MQPVVSTQKGRFPFTRAKLARGRHHVNELANLLDEHMARKPVLAIHYDRYDGGQYTGTLLAFTRKALGADAVMVFGDAIHNLRTALDHLINEVVAERGKPPTDLAFPYARTKESLGKQIREKMKDTTPIERDLVRNLQPYNGGNAMLMALHELDLRDKHRSPIAISIAVESHQVRYDGDLPSGAPKITHLCTFSPIPADVEPLLKPIPGATCMGVINEATFIPEIAEALPLEYQPVIQSLNQLADVVENIIDQFVALP